ncbi:unnamed protein product, partial [Amoebophrya sp. A25]
EVRRGHLVEVETANYDKAEAVPNRKENLATLRVAATAAERRKAEQGVEAARQTAELEKRIAREQRRAAEQARPLRSTAAPASPAPSSAKGTMIGENPHSSTVSQQDNFAPTRRTSKQKVRYADEADSGDKGSPAQVLQISANLGVKANNAPA